MAELRVEDVTVAFGALRALEDVSLTVQDNESIEATIDEADLKGPGLLPLTFSSSDHRGYEGEQRNLERATR